MDKHSSVEKWGISLFYLTSSSFIFGNVCDISKSKISKFHHWANLLSSATSSKYLANTVETNQKFQIVAGCVGNVVKIDYPLII